MVCPCPCPCLAISSEINEYHLLCFRMSSDDIFIFQKCVVNSVAKFKSAEKSLAKSILATLSIKKILDAEIIKEMCAQSHSYEVIVKVNN